MATNSSMILTLTSIAVSLRSTLRYLAILGGVAHPTRLPAETCHLLPRAGAKAASGDTWRYLAPAPRSREVLALDMTIKDIEII